ncbi:MAG TPA: hypothetical protein VFN91_18795 [Myxococcaceae bacterium]|nr:hypothetical protein [Myxococcaceae bacterium]
MRRIVGVVVSALVLLGIVSRARKEEQSEESKEGFACALHALSATDRVRHLALSARLVAAIRGRTEIADGYVFTVDESAMDWGSLAEWTRAERLCCPFFRMALRAHPHGEGLELELGGAPGVKRFILGELPVILAGG